MVSLSCLTFATQQWIKSPPKKERFSVLREVGSDYSFVAYCWVAPHPQQYAKREKWTPVIYFTRASKWHHYSEANLFSCVLGMDITEWWQQNGMIPLAGVCISPLL